MVICDKTYVHYIYIYMYRRTGYIYIYTVLYCLFLLFLAKSAKSKPQNQSKSKIQNQTSKTTTPKKMKRSLENIVLFFGFIWFYHFFLCRSLDFPSSPKTSNKKFARVPSVLGGPSPCGKAGLAPQPGSYSLFSWLLQPGSYSQALTAFFHGSYSQALTARLLQPGSYSLFSWLLQAIVGNLLFSLFGCFSIFLAKSAKSNPQNPSKSKIQNQTSKITHLKKMQRSLENIVIFWFYMVLSFFSTSEVV